MDEPHVQTDTMQGICAECHSLMERGVDDCEPLSDDEMSFLENHLDSCSECEHFRRVLDLFGDAPPVRDAFVSGVVAAHFQNVRKKTIQTRFVASFVAAAAAVVLLVATVYFFGEPGDDAAPGRPQNPIPMTLVAGTAEVSGRVASTGTNVYEGARLETGDQQTLVVSEALLSFGLAPNSDVEVVTASSDRVRLALKKGTVAVSLEPERHIAVDVLVGDYVVSVTGTIFGVQSDSQVSVQVVEGVVEVTSSDSDATSVKVVASRAYSPTDQSEVPLDLHQKREILSLLHLENASLRETHENSSDGLSDELSAVDAPLLRDQEAELGQDSQSAGGQRTHRKQVVSPEGRPHERNLSPRKTRQGLRDKKDKKEREALTPADYMRAARACRGRRDWKCAAESYRRVIERYPSDPLARTVIVPLAQIELKHLGHPKRSYRLYSDYLSGESHGPLSQEAYYGICQALEAMGDSEREKEALGQFLTRYPKSAYAPNARNRLRELRESGH